MKTCSFTAGLLIRGSVRKFLEKAIFSGYKVTYLETKSLLDSEFTIRGDEGHVIYLVRTLNDHYNQY